MDAEEKLLDRLPWTFEDGEKTAWEVANGGDPALDVLDQLADTLDVVRRRIAAGTLNVMWVRPTEEDVRAVRRLVQLAREGAPREALRELALRVYGITTNPGALQGLCGVLPWLAGEATRITRGDTTPRPDVVHKVLDGAAAYFERGGSVAGFVPTPEDLARVRRLRELATVEGGEELSERHRLAKELWARLPQDDISAATRRWATREGQWPDDMS